MEYITNTIKHLSWKYGEDFFWIAVIVVVMLLSGMWSASDHENEWKSEYRQMQAEEALNL